MLAFCKSPTASTDAPATCKGNRQPVVFVSHGPGPLPLLGRVPAMWKNWSETLRPIVEGAKPKAICVVSAHWDWSSGLAVLAPSKPTLMYDYYGFPKEAYNLKYPCPGISKELTGRVVDLLQKNFPKEKVTVNTKRGLDHGTFVPMIGILPKADVPIFQIALRSDYDYDWHAKLGEALKPLRDEGILIIGSGMTYHNGAPNAAARPFNDFLKHALRAKGSSSDEGVKIRQAELGRIVTDRRIASLSKACHPTAEHLIPLVLCAAAAGWGPAILKYDTPGAMDFIWDTEWPYDKKSASEAKTSE